MIYRENSDLMRLFNVDTEYKEDIEDALNHGYIVSYLSRRLAEELGHDERYCNMIADAGLLHDIGKLQISGKMYGRDEDMLRIEEMRYVRLYPELGYNYLCDKRIGTEELRRIVLHHHENYDGSGYPDRLTGESIPLGSRIIRVCDVYVSLISDRPYRRAFDSVTATELMIEEVKNFDMKVFLGFMSLTNSDEIKEVNDFVERINQSRHFEYNS